MQWVILSVLLLAGCAQLPPGPAEIQAKKFEAVPGQAVIYVVRDHPDHSEVPATIALDGNAAVTTYPGTFYRFEVAPGRHRLTGFGADTGSIALDAEAGRIYFIQQTLIPPGTGRTSYFRLVSEGEGRAVVARGQIVPGAR